MTRPWEYSSENLASRTRQLANAREIEIQKRKKLKPRDVLVRAAVSELTRRSNGLNTFEGVSSAIERRYGGCAATLAYVARAVSDPAATGTATWAAELVDTAVQDFISSDMAKQSAFAQLAERALTVTLEPGVGAVKVPARASPLTPMGAWVAESGPKPVHAGDLTATTLTPYKLSGISTFTEEMMDSSDIEKIVREVLAHDLGALLDTALLDSTAATALRPAGLFNGATAVTASAATPPSEAMVADLRALHAAVATSNPDAKTVFIVNPAQAVRVNLTAPETQSVITSGYMPVNAVGAVDCASVAMLVSQPTFAISTDAVLHMDTVPLPLATGVQGSGVLATPMRSAFQEDFIALRCVLRASWAKHRTGCTALATSVTW